MIKSIAVIISVVSVVACTTFTNINIVDTSINELAFIELPKVWDEGIPLGNGTVGALIWEKDGKLRFSLDRADLWDLRPMDNLNSPEWKFTWVKEQWEKDNYRAVQEKFDVPYNRSPAPSKIPGAALEFDISSLGEIEKVVLYLNSATCTISWKSGVTLTTFVHATEPIGWYRFEGIHRELSYDLIPPAYNLPGKSEADNPVTGQDLRRLEYPEGKMVRTTNTITYGQEGWGGFTYQVHIKNSFSKEKSVGCWSISSSFPDWERSISATQIVNDNMSIGWEGCKNTHLSWWKEFWKKSSINVPDTILQKQWLLEQYKFGSAARVGAPPISLQSVWTADNGKLPPWKGDFHHDLNTQLSYWPSYSGNHLDLERGFLEWLWNHKETFREYTRDYFGVGGINVPGVTTLDGKPMGGWIQYSFGPTVSAWLSQHFYLHWKYTLDQEFLHNKAYPWIKEVAVFLDNLSEFDENGLRKLPISSSPEIHDNRREAWFENMTNFDLSLIRWVYEKAAEMAQENGKPEEANNWKRILSEWPEYSIDEKTGLNFVNNLPYNESHRHFSHLMAFHPLGLIDVSNGDSDRNIIDNTISRLEEIGSSKWVGYSFSWLGNLKARALDGEGAVEALSIFATSFCLPNSFHVNGDQSGKGYSDFKYRPFTLEGNFAFASGLQEMLIQSHTGIIKVFPAIPNRWENVDFNTLRTEGAFLVSAIREKGKTNSVDIESLGGSELKLENPFEVNDIISSHDYKLTQGNILIFNTNPGDKISLKIN